MRTRTLKFIVNGQIIKQDPNCDFSDLIPGETKGYLRAEFSFSPEWNGFTKVASFYSAMGKEYEPQLIVENKKSSACMIPADAIKRRVFKIRVYGKNKDGLTLTTNKVAVDQNGGKT